MSKPLEIIRLELEEIKDIIEEIDEAIWQNVEAIEALKQQLRSEVKIE